jgi:hypothetical protein
MPQKPPLGLARKDPRFISTNRLIVTIGSSRYELDISIPCTELKSSPAPVIPIDRYFNKGRKKTIFDKELH